MSFEGNDDSNVTITTQSKSGKLVQVGLERIKNEYIVEGSSVSDLAMKYNVPMGVVEKLVEDNQLDKLRAAHIKHGLAQLQNIQLVQAEKLISLENQFKRIRIIQLEKTLADYMAYYSKYGHFYKVHPITLEVLKDTNGIPIQIKIPNVGPEITQLKESFSLSEGLKQLLSNIDDIINKPKDLENLSPDIIDVTNDFNNLFRKKKSEDED